MIDDKKMEEYGKVKREYDNFKKIRRDLGLKSYKIMNIEQMRKNLEELELIKNGRYNIRANC